MNSNSIKYRFITQWYEKKTTIIGLFIVLSIGAILIYNIILSYQILLKEMYKVVNQSSLFSTLLFVSIFLCLFCTLILIKLSTKLNRMDVFSLNYQKNDGKFQDLFQFSPIGSAIIDMNTDCFIAVNRTFCAMLDCSPEEIKGGQFETVFPINFKEETNYPEAKDNKNISGFSIEMQLSTQSGKTIWVNLTTSSYYDKKEHQYLKSVYIEDITFKKNTIHNELIVNNFKGIILECDVNTLKILFISESIESVLGFSVSEAIQKTNFWNDLIHPNDLERVKNTFRRVIQENISQEIEFRMIAKNEQKVWIRTVFSYNKENNFGVKGIMTDISNIKKVQKELKKMIRLVTEQNKKLINFSHIVSHNLRSQSTNIESISNFISSSKSITEQKKMIKLLQSASNSLNETVYDLNHVVNIKTKINLVYKTLYLKQYVLNTEKILADQIESSRSTIVNLIPPDLLISYNPACLENILYNLISNALRFKHPERDPVITIQWINEKNKNIIEISDNGIGIDLKKNEDKIFGMYNTFHKNTKSKGMGLFTTKNQIEAMGGSISVESLVDIGTTFKINLQ